MATIFNYYGISFFEIEAQGRKILVDPCIRKNRICPIKVEDITKADLILVTHGVPDHLGDALEIQRRTDATIIAGPGVRAHVLSHGVAEDKVIALIWGDFIEVGGIGIRAVECHHLSFFKTGDQYISCLPLSFIIYPEQGTRIYNIGDTSLFSDIKLIAELYRPNIALVPVGGTPLLTGGFTHLPPREAALCTQWVGPEVVIPTHYLEPAEADEFANIVSGIAPAVKIEILKPGESFVFDKLQLKPS